MKIIKKIFNVLIYIIAAVFFGYFIAWALKKVGWGFIVDWLTF